MMKTISLFLLLIPLYVFAGDVSIDPGNIVILQSEYPHKSSWTPNHEQIQNALMKIYEYINKPSGVSDWHKNEIAKIKKNFSEYRVQFVGIDVNGEKRIWCNFFKGRGFEYWQKSVVIVLDGGCNFWQIEYDVKSGVCLNFYSNGYA
jgi:hypothetical protein